MNKLRALALGILSAIGGFVDIGDLVFNSQAGALYGYRLIWAVIVGLVGIMVYAEMCGRVVAVSGRPVSDLVRERLGFGAGLVNLGASQIVNLLTLAAEVGGVAIVLHLLSGLALRPLVLLAALALGLSLWFLPFGILERVYSYLGLALLVFAVAAVNLHPDWGAAGRGAVPSMSGDRPLVYAYFAVGILGATLSPYEVFFYSSGGVEEGWTSRSLGDNRINALLGFGLGGVLSIAIMIVAAEVLLPRGIQPEFLGTAALGPAVALGAAGFYVALIGMLAAVGGAAIEVCLSGAYTVAQFFGWPWGKHEQARDAPRFVIAWAILLGLATLIILTGVNPVQVTEYAVIFSAVALPLTYLPIFIVANDRRYMGQHANGRLANALGWVYLAVILVVAIAAVPLLMLTSGGQG
ncbi:MAG: NRAMP family divalent metal transporter [Candidatus Dormibacteria bacterium]